MKTRFATYLIGAAAVLAFMLVAEPSSLAQAVGNRIGGSFFGEGAPLTPGSVAIKNINISTPNSPQYQTLSGDADAKRFVIGKWLEVEVEFASSVPAREMMFRYYILINGTLLVGDVVHVDVPAAQSLFSVMYVAPRTLTTLLRGQALTSTTVQNIDVQILRPGIAAPLAEKMLRQGPPFYTNMQQVPNLVLNKSQTPFAPLWWDRYEAIKPSGGPQ